MFLYSAVIVALCFGHYFHLQYLAERDKHFSHLSSLERELSFRSEMAMYYSYFKDLISTPTFEESFSKIIHDNVTEYPSKINALQRFNIYPELILSVLYRGYIKLCQLMNIPLMECWQVERGGDMPAVTSCEGFGEPSYFYVTMVFFLNGWLPVFIFLFGCHLSNGSKLGGLIAALCFFFNHRECTRVMWTPPLRESFAYPFVLLQNLLVERCLSDKNRQSTSRFIGLVLCNVILLTCWQFSQFALLTQVFALSFLYGGGFFDRDFRSLFTILWSHFCGVFVASVLLFGNRLLLTSLYTASLLNFLFILFGHNHTKSLGFPVGFLFRCSLMLAGTFSARHFLASTLFGGVEDDSHIMDLLKTKLMPSFKSFHSQLYVCAPEFDFLGLNALLAITKTLLLPVGIFVLMRFLFRLATRRQTADPHLVYHFLQLGAYAIMALFIMRLKLFFTPFLCITVALVADIWHGSEERSKENVNEKEKSKPSRIRRAAFVVLCVAMLTLGAQNMREEWSSVNEFANWPLESLINWISANTKPTDSFAGAMPTTAVIKLSAQRPIANHPHYEDISMRNRTLDVYTIYSRKPMAQIHSIFRRIGIHYVVVETIWCESRRYGCALAEMYDIIDAANRDHDPACFKMIDGQAEPYFKLVFQQDPYYLLRVMP